MTVAEIKTLLTKVDPDVQRYDHDHEGGKAYTTWRELRPIGCYGDGREAGTIRFQVDRFTQEEDEAMAESILETRSITNGILAKHTGKAIQEIDAATAFDNYMNAEQSVAFGLCDEIRSSLC